MTVEAKLNPEDFRGVLSPLVLEALRARGLSDAAIMAMMGKRRKSRDGLAKPT